MTTVHVVLVNYPYAGDQIHGAYSTPDAARAAAESMAHWLGDVWVAPVELDAPPRARDYVEPEGGDG